MNQNNNSLPPIIEDMIGKLLDSKTPLWNKDNISSTLFRIEKACSEANRKYTSQREKNIETKKTRSKTNFARVSSNQGKY